MSDTGMPKQWTEEQWSRVQQVVHDQAMKARKAASFLSLYGPLPPGSATLPKERVSESTPGSGTESEDALSSDIRHLEEERSQALQDLTIVLYQVAALQQATPAPDDKAAELTKLQSSQKDLSSKINNLTTDIGTKQHQLGQAQNKPDFSKLRISDNAVLSLTTVAVNISLTTTQQSQPDLSSALTLFARAASVIARVEDAIIFRGVDYKKAVENLPAIFTVSPGSLGNRLLSASSRKGNTIPIAYSATGENLVSAVADGVATLDEQGYLPPYALALGKGLFVLAQSPTPSLVLPSERIQPLIEGPLLRTGALPSNEGVLVSLAAHPVEIVVASDIHVRFLQLTAEARYLYRVSQRFALRVKEPNAIITFQMSQPPTKVKDNEVAKIIRTAKTKGRVIDGI